MLNLYKLMNYKRKNSILKSVNILSPKLNESFRIVEIEPYDQTGVNALDGTPAAYDRAIETVKKALVTLEKRVTRRHNIYRVCVFSNTYGTFEFIFDPSTGKEY
ncbi:hypothetical protein [Staphylococcus nepalensis]|uniref:hypothetical protein n=1 Tax=Staphylococcus nepalensis TaxID=214473 RepID=UPI0024B9C6B3|nr:hypothetical protein [Staphylococcus nepalensis]